MYRHPISPKRKKELLGWCDKEKWPDWAMVIYRCKVTIEECRWLYTLLLNYSIEHAAYVATGTGRYFGDDNIKWDAAYIGGWDMGRRDGETIAEWESDYNQKKVEG